MSTFLLAWPTLIHVSVYSYVSATQVYVFLEPNEYTTSFTRIIDWRNNDKYDEVY